MKRMRIVAAGLWLLLFAPPLVAQELGPHFQKIREGIYVYGIDDLPGRDPTSNCGIIITQEGVVLIDSGPNPPDSLIILKAVKQLTSQPIRFLINTETHNDHVTGNFVFLAAGGRNRLRRSNGRNKKLLRPQAQRKIDGRIERNARSVSRFPSRAAARGIQRPDDFKYGRSDFRADPTQEYPQ